MSSRPVVSHEPRLHNGNTISLTSSGWTDALSLPSSQGRSDWTWVMSFVKDQEKMLRQSSEDASLKRRGLLGDKQGGSEKPEAWREEEQDWHPYELTSQPASLISQQQTPGLNNPSASAGQRSGGRTSRGVGASSLSAPNFGKKQEVLRCQVETCLADLCDLKEYYLRYKICVKCQKLRSIIRDGKRQRFCQLCGRFHNIEAFDGDKRSCRTRLNRHNARRRKQKLDSGGSQGLGGAASGSMDVDEAPKAEEASMSSRQKRPTKKAANMAGGSDADLGQPLRWPYLDGREKKPCLSPFDNEIGPSTSSPTRSRPSASMDPSSTHDGRGSPEGHSSPRSQVSEVVSKPSDKSTSTAAALVHAQGSAWSADLLSPVMDLAGPSIRWGGSTPSLLPISVQNGVTPLPLDLFEPATNTCKPLDMLDLDALHPEHFFSESLAEQDSVRGDVDMYSCPASQGSMLDLPRPCEGLSTMGLGISPMHLPLPMEPFPLDQSRRAPPMPDLRPVAGLNHAFPPAPPEYSDPVYAAQQTMSNYVPMAGFEALIRPREPYSAPMGQPRQTGRQAEVENARFVLGGEHLPTFAPVEVRARLSAKLINIRPEDLPANLRQHLLAMMNVGVHGLEGYIRPGCVYLTVSVAVAANDAATVKAISLQAAFDRLLTLPDADFWRNHTSVIQLSKQLALVRGGRVVRTVDLDLCTVYPTLDTISPVAVLAGASSVLEIKGTNLHLPGCVVIARCQGKQRYLQPVDEQGRAAPNRGRSSTSLHVVLPADLIAGAWQIEVSCKSSLTDFQVVMVINNAEAVSELRQLEQPGVLENSDSAGTAANSMLLDRVMEYLNVMASVKAGNYDHLRTYQDADYQILVKLAQHVFLIATRKGWPAVARMVLGVACMGASSIVDVIRSMHSMSGGFSLLHLASCSRNPKMVEFVLEWTSSAGFELSAAVPGPGGFTPMHLAALLDDDGRIAVLLTSLCVDGKDAWQVSGDLMTPYDLARAAGTAGNIQNRLLAAAHQADEIAAAGDAAILKAYLLEDSDDEHLLTDSDLDSESNEDTWSMDDKEFDSLHTAGVGRQHVVSRSAPQTAKSSVFSESTGVEDVHCRGEGSGSRYEQSVDQMPSTKSLHALAMQAPCDDHSPKKYLLQNLKDNLASSHMKGNQKDNFLSSVKGMFNMGQGKSRTRSVSQMLQEVDFDDEEDHQGKYFGLPPLYWVSVFFFLVCTGLASFFNRCAAHYLGTAPGTAVMPSHP